MNLQAIKTTLATALAIWQVAKEMLPFAVDIVDQLEALLPEKGQGAQKLEIAKQWLAAHFAELGELEVKFEQVWPKLQASIAAIVAARKLLKPSPAH